MFFFFLIFIKQSGSFIGGNMNVCLSCQTLKDSYTTLVYAKQSHVNKNVVSRNGGGRIGVPVVVGGGAAATASQPPDVVPSDRSPHTKEKTRKKSQSNLRDQQQKQHQQHQQSILCVISSLGYCVVYRNNGCPR